MDSATLVGLALALAAVVGGHVLEGGHLGSILQPTAALIVLGGTLGAASVQFPAEHIRLALAALRQLVRPRADDPNALLNSIVMLAQKARREGLLAIERDVTRLPRGFLRRSLELAVDGTEGRVLRSALELDLARAEEDGEVPARVFEAMGGYAPTIGILGAVMGLIHVMENLTEPAKLGPGIAVAFVATIYGVGCANLLFLPIAGKLRHRHRDAILAMELVLEGTCAIAEGQNPRLIERVLGVYLTERRLGREGRDIRVRPTSLQARAQT